MGQPQKLTPYSGEASTRPGDGRQRNGGANGGAAGQRSGTAVPPGDPLAALDAERVRRDALAALRAQALGQVPLERLAGDAAALVREQLGVDACRVWSPLGGEGSFELIASAGKLDEAPRPPPANLAGNGPLETDDGLVFALTAYGGHAVAVALHSVPRPDFSHDDLMLVEALAQVLVGSAWGRSSEQLLALAERRYRELIERLPVVTYLAEYGPAGKWLYVSPQIERLLGFPPEEWLVDSNFWWSRIHPDDREMVELEEARCAQTLEPLSMEYRMIARDDSVVWIRDEGALGRHAEGDGGAVQLEGVLTDITERRQAEEELSHRADHDELTGLANRRRFAEELGRRRAAGTAGAVAIVDVDDLKYFNDALGHAAGDSLLRAVGAALERVLGPNEFLARFGGDEFALVLEAPTDEAVRPRLAALLRAVRERESRVPARASAGAVLFDPETGSTDEELIVAADIALHEAKERGGDRYMIFEGSGHERLAWVGHVREAIDAERLRLHAQPIFELAGGTEIGCEVLVRMLEPDGSVLSPAAFLPTAERFGLIAEIDCWVAERGIELATRRGTVTINISARSITDPALLPRITAALERSGADPAQVMFEVTETAAATATEELRSFGAAIERLGCSLAIDDFGTGFGSLTYLKHLPVRYLKIDMEFVRGLRDSLADRAIVESIVTIAKSLDMLTVAEGVEDAETLDDLRKMGVDYAQGYHLGRPAPVTD